MYRIVWEFDVDPARAAEFELEYGPEGAWVALFRGAPEYLGSELHPSPGHRGRYVTVDRWTSRAAYERFRAARAGDYADLDARCEALTLTERLVTAEETPTTPTGTVSLPEAPQEIP